MPEVTLNYLAIVVAAAISMALGMLWYSKAVFGKQWMALRGMDEKKIAEAERKSMAKPVAIAAVAALVMSYVLAHFVDYAGAETVAGGALAGFWLWLGFIATVLISSVLWEERPWSLYLLNNGYHLIALLIMGAILAVWV